MLEVVVPEREIAIERPNGIEFVTVKETKLQLEHSLISLSKWESKWKVPFLSEQEHTPEQMIDYMKFMTINQHVDPNVYLYMPLDLQREILEYVKTDQTATKVYDRRQNRNGRRETLTSELFYYWMVYYNIDWSCEKWHLSRLLALIKICNAKGSNDNRMDMNSIYKENARLNAMRQGKG